MTIVTFIPQLTLVQENARKTDSNLGPNLKAFPDSNCSVRGNPDDFQGTNYVRIGSLIFNVTDERVRKTLWDKFDSNCDHVFDEDDFKDVFPDHPEYTYNYIISSTYYHVAYLNGNELVEDGTGDRLFSLQAALQAANKSLEMIHFIEALPGYERYAVDYPKHTDVRHAAYHGIPLASWPKLEEQYGYRASGYPLSIQEAHRTFLHFLNDSQIVEGGLHVYEFSPGVINRIIGNGFWVNCKDTPDEIKPAIVELWIKMAEIYTFANYGMLVCNDDICFDETPGVRDISYRYRSDLPFSKKFYIRDFEGKPAFNLGLEANCGYEPAIFKEGEALWYTTAVYKELIHTGRPHTVVYPMEYPKEATKEYYFGD